MMPSRMTQALHIGQGQEHSPRQITDGHFAKTSATTPRRSSSLNAWGGDDEFQFEFLATVRLNARNSPSTVGAAASPFSDTSKNALA